MTPTQRPRSRSRSGRPEKFHIVVGHLQQGSSSDIVVSGIDENVDSAEFSQDRLDGGIYLRVLSHIAANGHRSRASIADF